jgi:hypothetical protein
VTLFSYETLEDDKAFVTKNKGKRDKNNKLLVQPDDKRFAKDYGDF